MVFDVPFEFFWKMVNSEGPFWDIREANALKNELEKYVTGAVPVQYRTVFYISLIR